MNDGDLRRLVRPDLLDLAAYPAASPERGLVRLHANESAYDYSASALNRYPEPQPRRLLETLAALYGVAPSNLLATRGSDDAIDLLVRCFCRAGADAVVICPPTFGMYAMAARLQNARLIEAPLEQRDGFALDRERLLARCDDATRIVFICSPNNPTGNLVPRTTIVALCNRLRGRALVVVDEAYIEFADADSAAPLVNDTANLVVLRTLSKAWALAGARCGALLANRELIDIVRPAMPPYALPTPTIEAALQALAPANAKTLRDGLSALRTERARLRERLDLLAAVRRTWPSEGNFILAEVERRAELIAACRAGGLLIRALGAPLDDHVRITVGTPAENARLLAIIGALR